MSEVPAACSVNMQRLMDARGRPTSKQERTASSSQCQLTPSATLRGRADGSENPAGTFRKRDPGTYDTRIRIQHARRAVSHSSGGPTARTAVSLPRQGRSNCSSAHARGNREPYKHSPGGRHPRTQSPCANGYARTTQQGVIDHGCRSIGCARAERRRRVRTPWA